MISGQQLNGIFPPLTTPFDQNGDVDYDSLKRNLTRYNQTGLAGYIAFGSNGEAVHLSEQEQSRVLETIKREAAPGMLVVAGVNELSTRGAVAATKRALESGADAVLVITPYFYKAAMTQSVLGSFYREVADNSPLPVLIYNVPQNTGVIIETSAIATLASHGNIIGIKDSAGNMAAVTDTIRRAPESFSVLVGNGGILYPALMMGAAGAVLAIACLAPAACVELYKAVGSGDQAKARDLQRRIAPLSHLVTAHLGVAGLKAAMGIAGFFGGAPRRPLESVSDSDRERIRTDMLESGLFPELG
jgi:4-hydroxy-tetrahydrodipicolinate synthase